MAEVLYLSPVDAVLDPATEQVRRCTLAAVDGRCRLLSADDAGSLGAGRVVDGHGIVAVAGLIDAHVHWGAAARDRWAGSSPDPQQMGGEFAAFLPVERAACLESGVTTVKSMGDPVEWILGMRAAVAGGMPGPRVHAVGPIFTAPGGHPAGDVFRGDDWLIAEACRQFGRGHEAAAAEAVEVLARRGVDAIKVVYDSGRGTLPRLDEGVLAAILAAARGRGLRVHAHVGTTEEALAALEMGVEVLEHVPDAAGGDGWDQVASALRTRHAAICPTLVVSVAHVSADVVDSMAAWVSRLAATGVAVHCGTDLGNPGVSVGRSVHEEMALFRQGGMSPGQALAAAVGRLADGAHADWVLVRGDPLRDLGVLRHPCLVVQGGRVVAGTERKGWAV